MERSVAIFVVINFLIIGASHFVQPRVWADFFLLLHSKGRVGAFINGFLTLFVGSIIVAFHNVWSGFPTILTLIGWAYLVKSATIFLHPDWNLHSMALVQKSPEIKFRIGGVLMLLIALLLLWCVFAGSYEVLD